jgi:hypothetical protein
LRSEEEFGSTTGGSDGAPRSIRRFLRFLVGLGVFAIAVWAATTFLGRLPSDTRTGSLVIRGLVGFGIGLILVVVVRRMLRALVQAPPAPPRRVDARTADVTYECGVCGTRVRLEVASTAKAPRHCGEEMEASVG